MSRKVITVDIFDSASVDVAIGYVDELQRRLDKITQGMERLAQLGVRVAEDAFTAVAIDMGSDPVKVTCKTEKYGFTITASGRQVAYMEFGAGVFYNGIEPYEGSRPVGIDPIGGHDTIGNSGFSLGNFDSWSYKKGKETVKTHGTPAAQGMYLAQKAIAEEATKIIKEICKW